MVAYRQAQPLQTFPLARPQGRQQQPLVTLVVGGVLFAGCTALLLRRPSVFALVMLLLVVAGILVPVLHSRRVARSAEQLGPGPRELKLFHDRVEVPSADGEQLLLLPLETLDVRLDHRSVQVNFITVSDSLVLVLRSADQERQLSYRLFGGRTALHEARDAIVAQQRQVLLSLREST